jgi:hypothetical protein
VDSSLPVHTVVGSILLRGTQKAVRCGAVNIKIRSQRGTTDGMEYYVGDENASRLARGDKN